MRTNLFKAIIGIVVIFVLILLHTCKPETVIVIPQVSTVSVSDIRETEATLKGKLNFDGGGDILERGFYLNGDKILADNDDQAEFELKVSHLKDDTKYICQAFARNKAGTAYGDSLTFHTLKKHDPLSLPPLKIWEASNVGKNSATLNCLIERAYGLLGLSFVFEYSQDLDFSTFLSADAELLDHEPIGKIAYANISDLQEGSTYYYRLGVSSTEQSAYSAVASFTTEVDGVISLPGMEIWDATELSTNEATLNAFINRNTDLEGIVFSFEYSTKVSFASYQSKAASISLRVNGAKAWAKIDNLDPETMYYYRLKATSEGNSAYSPIGQFVTYSEEPPIIYFPEVTILEATNITANEATINAIILSKELEGFEFIFQYTDVISFNNPIDKEATFIDNPNGTFVTADLDNLWPNKNHRYRLKMMYGDEIAYSEVGIFTTKGGSPPPVEFPEVELLDATDITESTVTISAIIKTDDMSELVSHIYLGQNEEFMWPALDFTSAVDSHPEGFLVTFMIENLPEGTHFYYKLKMSLKGHVAFSPCKNFTTLIYDIPFRVFQGQLYIVTTDEEGNVYLGGTKTTVAPGQTEPHGHGVVAKFNPEGELLQEIIIPKEPLCTMNVERSLLVKDGIIYVSYETGPPNKIYLNAYDSNTGEYLYGVDLEGDYLDEGIAVDNEGCVYKIVNNGQVKKINPSGQIVKTINHSYIGSIALFNDKILVGGRGKKNDLWHSKITCFDRDLNIIWEDFGVNSGAGLSSTTAIISFSENNKIVVGEVIGNNTYFSKYNVEENGLSVIWNNFYQAESVFIGLFKRNNNEFVVFDRSNIPKGPKLLNLNNNLLWEASPYRAGRYVSANHNNLFLMTNIYLSIPIIYDLP